MPPYFCIVLIELHLPNLPLLQDQNFSYFPQKKKEKKKVFERKDVTPFEQKCRSHVACST